MTAPDPAAERLVQQHLESGERVVWCGRPTAGPLERYTMRLFIVGLLSAIGVGVAWVSYILIGYWVYSTDPERSALYAALKQLGPVAERIALVVLGVTVLAGLVGLTQGRWLAPRVVYAVTDRRLLFITSSACVHWIGRRELRDVTATEHGDGTGDLVFVRDRSGLELLNGGQFTAFPRNWLGSVVAQLGLDRLGIPWPRDPGIREAFVGISNPRAVRDLVLGESGS